MCWGESKWNDAVHCMWAAWQYVQLALVGAAAWLRVRLCTAKRRDDWAVYRVYAFEEPDNLDKNADAGDVRLDEHKFHELPARFFDPETWESDTQDATGWDRVRVEVRYRHGNGKYRMVLRPGDTCVFPPPAKPRGFHLAVLAASLHGKSVDFDVTRRVLKYQGANKDFHGTRVTVRDMFPFDDHDDNAVRFSHLRVMDTTARVRTIPYLSNACVSPAAASAAAAAAQMPGDASMNGSVASASALGRLR